MPVAAAIIGGASVIGAGVSAAGAKKAAKTQAKGAEAAAKAQQEAADKALIAQKEGTAEARKAAEEAATKAQAAQETAFKASNDIYGETSLGAQREYERTYKGVADEYQAAADRARQDQQSAFNQQMGLQSPYQQAGLTAQQQIMRLMGLGGDQAAGDYGQYARPFGMDQFEQDPGYAFRQSEGMRALERSAAARGGLLSGNMLKGVQRFGQDLASQEYQNAFSRYQTERNARLGTLQGLMGAGQSAANVMTNAAGQYGQQRSQTALGLGQQLAQNRANLGSATAGNTYNLGQQLAQNRLNLGQSTAQNAYNVANAVAAGALGLGNAGANSAYYAGNAAAQGATNAAAARASGYVGAANAINQGLSGIANYAVQAPLYNAMAQYYGGGTPSASSIGANAMSAMGSLPAPYPASSYGLGGFKGN